VEVAQCVACLLVRVGPAAPFIQQKEQRAEHGVKALDGADGDAANAIELVRGEVLDVVELGELAAVGGDELLELGHGLASEIGAIDEEEDVARAGMLDEPVGERAGGGSCRRR